MEQLSFDFTELTSEAKEESKRLYKYGMRLRGFSPGCQPKDGFIERLDDTTGKYLDVIVYDRKLSFEETKEYELDPIIEITEEVVNEEIRRSMSKAMREEVVKHLHELTPKEKISRIKNIYGEGGHCGPGEPKVNHDGKGFEVADGFGEGRKAILLKWPEVVMRIENMIQNKAFL